MTNTVSAILKETLGKSHIPTLSEIISFPSPADIEETFITGHRTRAAHLGDKNRQCTMHKTHNLLVSYNTTFHTYVSLLHLANNGARETKHSFHAFHVLRSHYLSRFVDRSCLLGI